MKKWLLALLVAAGAAVGWGDLRKSAPPKISFTQVKRTTLVSTLPTNGKVEPFDWQAVRAERAGILSRVNVRDGEAVAKGVCPLLESLSCNGHGIDISYYVCRLAARRYANVFPTVCDVRHLPYPDRSFDVVVSLSTLDHFDGVAGI